MRYAWLALALVACSKPETKPAPQPEASSTPVAKAAEPPPPAKQFVGEASFAHFVKDQIFECVDIAVVIPPPPGAPSDWKPSEDIFGRTVKAMSKDATKLSKTCDEQFADRTVLASCTMKQKGKTDAGTSASATVTANFYNFEDVGKDDSQMKDCLKGGGDWKAVSRDSVEWKKAKLEHSRKGLEKASERLNKAAGLDD